MRINITGHQTLAVILSSITEECKLLKTLSNQLKLILVCSPLILWLNLEQEGKSLRYNSYRVSLAHIPESYGGISNSLSKWQAL